VLIRGYSQDGSYLNFDRPEQIITTSNIEEVLPKLRQIESAVNDQGLYAAGFLAYEAAPAFDPALQTQPESIAPLPLLWFGLYEQPETITLPAPDTAYSLGDWRPSVSPEAFEQAINQIREYIAAGETYQVNYTFRLQAAFQGDPLALFTDLVPAQRPNYAAYNETEDFAICSASPELFFTLDGDLLTSRPMKGTAARGTTQAGDRQQAEWLQHSEKNRAENVMIVDMIRNDIGRVAQTGTVNVPDLFTVERYPTLWQMTSTVTGRTTASLSDILAALFPCASITGAPKVRTMRLISQLETQPRGLYTGCIGYLAPGRQAQFNVAIRTVTVDKRRQEAVYGVGSGIVWDSVARDEYQECQVKARILTERRPPFSLLETMLWTPEGGIFLLAEHLQRLADSAAYFDYPLDLEQLRQKLAETTAGLPPQPHKLRLLLDDQGRLTLETMLQLPPDPQKPFRIALPLESIQSDNIFLYHKTTHRRVYEQARLSRPDCDDVLLWNERGEITETTIANVLVRLDGRWLTPPITSGLLPGTHRAHLLAQGAIQEQIITLDDLPRMEEIHLINSVRERWKVSTIPGTKVIERP
jgi:para-aminobenzoate synthetase/4-amino-4-deoxychorismate lyase